jgi:hypothetical protein
MKWKTLNENPKRKIILAINIGEISIPPKLPILLIQPVTYNIRMYFFYLNHSQMSLTNITNEVCTIWPFFVLCYPFGASQCRPSAVSRRHWYPIEFWSSKLTNRLLSPWPLSLQCHCERPHLQANASQLMHEEQTLAAVIIMFGSILYFVSLFWTAMSDHTVPLSVKLTVLPYDAMTVSMVTVLLYHATTLQVRKLSVRLDRVLAMSWTMMILVGQLWTEVQTSPRPRPDIRTYTKRLARVGKPL